MTMNLRHLPQGMERATGECRIRTACQKPQLAPNRKLPCRRLQPALHDNREST